MVSSYLTAIGTEIALARKLNLLKEPLSRGFVPQTQQMIEGWNKADPPTSKKLPVEVDILELLVNDARKGSSQKDMAVADWTLIAFYYLKIFLRIIQNRHGSSK